MIGIVDCNNFYASCERVFNPSLINKPVVVLSNNDGCIIARSNEAKAMGIKMGEAFYKVKDELEKKGVAIFSSNYTLYGDMSRRVMMLLSTFSPKITQYSIDEAFLDLNGFGNGDELREYGLRIVKTIGKGTGIPVTLGIASTKTLAKMASIYGKRYKGYKSVCIIDSEEKRIKALSHFDIGDVWGIGYKSAELMKYHGIKTALDFANKEEPWVRRMLSVTGARTWRELNGISCIDVESLPLKNSICTSRSFANEGLCKISDVEEAIANFAAACVRKLRAQRSYCSAITVFAYTSRFSTNNPSAFINATKELSVATNGLEEIVAKAVELLNEHWVDGMFFYKKAGVIVSGITSSSFRQTYLFDNINRERQESLNCAIDEINRRNGHNMVKIAVQGTNNNWKLKNTHLTKHYTTNINETIEVK